MASRGVTRNPGYIAGSHWAICDLCGFQFRAEELKKTWDNKWVCADDYEPRHPQEFLRVMPEKISVDEPIRLEQLGDYDLKTAANTSLSNQALVGTAIAGLHPTNLDESNARSALPAYASAGYAIAGLENVNDNLAEVIPIGTFNPNTL